MNEGRNLEDIWEMNTKKREQQCIHYLNCFVQFFFSSVVENEEEIVGNEIWRGSLGPCTLQNDLWISLFEMRRNLSVILKIGTKGDPFKRWFCCVGTRIYRAKAQIRGTRLMGEFKFSITWEVFLNQ